jgi:predicted RNA-binding protein YlxR (DUF448 family)
MEIVTYFLKETVQLDVPDGRTDHVARLGRRRGERLALVKFVTFAMKLNVLRNTKCSGLEDEGRQLPLIGVKKGEEGVIPYIKDGERRGHGTYLKKDRHSGQTYELKYLTGIFRLNQSSGLNTLVDNRQNWDDINWQEAENAEFCVSG